MMMEDMSVLFSGGPDSTLAALYGLDKVKRVHLLTFHHRLMSRTENQIGVVKELKEIFGDERIIYHEERIDSLFSKCYFTGILKRITKYRTFYIPWICGGCKMAMHASTIAYNRAHHIAMTFDGAHQESAPYFPAQTEAYIEVMKEFYQSYGMQYECPVYGVDGTDEMTEQYGLLSTLNTKREHVFFSTQHTCLIGLLLHAHARLYYRPLRGRNRMERIAGEFLQQMINGCRPFLPRIGE